MKRKLMIGLISAVFLACCFVGLAACERTGGSGTGGVETDTPQTGCYESGEKHLWDEGVVTTPQTCITPGVITYTCLKCGAVRKELIDSDGVSHRYAYDYDETEHWGTCRLCGEVTEKQEHVFGDSLYEEEKICADCGYTVPLSEYGYEVIFEAPHAKIFVYKTQDYSAEGMETTVAYSRDSESGALVKNGDGQVNFLVVPDVGYGLADISVEGGYKNLKGPEDTGVENLYRITKITSELAVTVTVQIAALELPIMQIDTENGAEITSKEVYLTASITVSNADELYCFESAAAQIRGRGNTSWEMPKKSYRLKFGSKTDLFGNGAAKNWTLIANYGDPSLLRNYLAYSVGSLLEGISDTTTTTQFIELFLNGEYLGVYLVCEQNEVGANRVNVSESLDSFDTGYLIELDGRSDSDYNVKISDGDVTFTIDHHIYNLKSPDIDDTEEVGQSIEGYVAFIRDYMQQCLNAFNSGTWEEVQALIDTESFSDSYIVNELFKTIDVGMTSFFLYKDAGGKLCSGPIWDYDVSSGNCSYAPNEDFVHTIYAISNVWYEGLMQYAEFRELVAQKLLQYHDTIVAAVDQGIAAASQYANAIKRNFIRWDILGKKVWPNTDEIAAIDTWEGQVEYLRDWLLESLDYLISVYCPTE